MHTANDRLGQALADRYRIALHMDMFNLNNSNAIQGRETRLSTVYGRVSSVLAPRLLRFGLKTYF